MSIARYDPPGHASGQYVGLGPRRGMGGRLRPYFPRGGRRPEQAPRRGTDHHPAATVGTNGGRGARAGQQNIGFVQGEGGLFRGPLLHPQTAHHPQAAPGRPTRRPTACGR